MMLNKFNPAPEAISARLELQRNFIDARLEKFGRTLEKYDAKVLRLRHKSSTHAVQDEARNNFQAFFKTLHAVRACECCGLEVKGLQRAHHENTSRPEMVSAVIERLCDAGEEIADVSCVIREFLKDHKHVPIWLLCTQCHRAYDTKPPPLGPT
jgi:hypothetical protein